MAAVRGRVSAFGARTVHAAVEGLAFVWTQEGAVLAAGIPCQRGLCGLLPRSQGKKPQCIQTFGLWRSIEPKFAHVMLTTTPPKHKDDPEQAALDSIWDWEPPGDLVASGAWKIMRELVRSLNRMGDDFPELASLHPLPIPELAVRLCFLFDYYQRNPVVDDIPASELRGEVPQDLLEALPQYLYLADQAYECSTEAQLSGRLDGQGYELSHCKLEATWAEHCPAYFLATNPEEHRVLVSIRGTAEVEDVITDLIASPEEFDGTGHLAHSGMLQAAIWLCGRLSGMAKGLADAGWDFVIVGHSLGAGVASLLGMLLKRRGIEKVHCYVFGAPPCMSPELAAACRDYVLAVAFRDDCVAHFSPQALAGLHAELCAFDWRAAAKGNDVPTGLQTVTKTLEMVGGIEVEPSKETLEREEKRGEEERAAKQEQEQSPDNQPSGYTPALPGRVLYISRAKPELDADGPEDLRRALVDGETELLRKIHLSGYMVSDHTTASYYKALGSPNLTAAAVKAEEEKAEGGCAPKHEDGGTEESCSEKGGKEE